MQRYGSCEGFHLDSAHNDHWKSKKPQVVRRIKSWGLPKPWDLRETIG